MWGESGLTSCSNPVPFGDSIWFVFECDARASLRVSGRYIQGFGDARPQWPSCCYLFFHSGWAFLQVLPRSASALPSPLRVSRAQIHGFIFHYCYCRGYWFYHVVDGIWLHEHLFVALWYHDYLFMNTPGDSRFCSRCLGFQVVFHSTVMRGNKMEFVSKCVRIKSENCHSSGTSERHELVRWQSNTFFSPKLCHVFYPPSTKTRKPFCWAWGMITSGPMSLRQCALGTSLLKH